MNSNSRLNPSRKQVSPNPNSNTGQVPTTAYRPSVPITVYRELAGELQTTQAQLEAVKMQNHRLMKQNQQLQQEVHNLLQSAHNLQQIVTTFDNVAGQPIVFPSAVFQTGQQVPVPPLPQPEPEVIPPPPSPLPEMLDDEEPEDLVIEVKETKPRRPAPPESSEEVSGWLLAVAIILIILTAFGTGFLVVRPLLEQNRSR